MRKTSQTQRKPSGRVVNLGVGYAYCGKRTAQMRTRVELIALHALRQSAKHDGSPLNRASVESIVTDALQGRDKRMRRVRVELSGEDIQEVALRVIATVTRNATDAGLEAQLHEAGARLSALTGEPTWRLGSCGFSVRPGFMQSVSARLPRRSSEEDIVGLSRAELADGYYPFVPGETVRRVITVDDPALQSAGRIVAVRDDRYDTVFYHRAGSRRTMSKGTLLLLPGAGAEYSTAAKFAAIINRFERLGWRTIGVDMPVNAPGSRDPSLADMGRYIAYLTSIIQGLWTRYGEPPAVLAKSFHVGVMLEFVMRYYPQMLTALIPMSGYSKEGLEHNMQWFWNAVEQGVFKPYRAGVALANQLDPQLTWWNDPVTPVTVEPGGWQTPILYLAGKKDREYPAGAWQFWQSLAHQTGQQCFIPADGQHNLLDSSNKPVFTRTVARINEFLTMAFQAARAQAQERYLIAAAGGDAYGYGVHGARMDARQQRRFRRTECSDCLLSAWAVVLGMSNTTRPGASCADKYVSVPIPVCHSREGGNPVLSSTSGSPPSRG